MLIYPAIDLYGGKAVRLYKGDYNQMTVYNDDPLAVARDFKRCGATHIHLVDLEGARDGNTPNLDTVCRIKEVTGLFCEVGGGIRTMEVIDRYISAGIDRVILGTAAVTNPEFVRRAVETYGDKIAVGIDIKDGFVAIKGWLEKSRWDAMSFCREMESKGIKTLICTDISKDGAMQGTNRQLYQTLSQQFCMQIVASGGISFPEEISALQEMGIYGAIIGKALYDGKLPLEEALKRCGE